MTRLRTFLAIAVSLAAPVGAAGCAPEGADAQSDNLVAKSLADAADVQKDRLVFPSDVISGDLRSRISAFEKATHAGKTKEDVENVLVVGDRAHDAVEDGAIADDSDNPYGFMRRALSFEDEGGKVTIMTEDASLAEVFAELDENGMVDIGVGEAAPEQEWTDAEEPGVEAQATKKLKPPKIPTFDFSGKEFYRNGDDYVRLSTASLSIDPTLDVGLTVRARGVQEMHTILDATIRAEVVIEGNFTITPPVPIAMEVFKAKYPLPPLGPIPMTLGLRVIVGCQVKATGAFNVQGGAGVTFDLRGGVQYDKDGGVQPIAEAPSVEPYLVEPSYDVSFDGGGSARCYVEPRLELLFYDTLGPYVSIMPYSIFTLDPTPNLSIVAGAGLHIGGVLRVFDTRLAQVDKDFDTHTQVY